ncbi:hypothetical protein [Candidatus Amarolinea dominans]|uniref:hypothetical protein n=1 Tax=Candidatus Amarolinea dominans TaxID=3140696 RepID=UPI003134BB16|nr:hypothetical protein [Anaerolineae bacterium]
MSLGGQTLSRIQSLERLYRRGYRSKTVDTTIDKLLSLERDHARRRLVRIEQHLHAFEALNRLPSEEFYRRFQAYALGDAADMFEWSAFYQMWQSVEDQLATLGSEASG